MKAWNYFLTLERDVVATTAFVEPALSNFHTYSDRFAGLLLLIGSEVDVVSKELCRQINADAPAREMGDRSAVILGRYPLLYTVDVDVTRYDLSLRPWASWGEQPPAKAAWWGAYNAVKHDRLAKRHEATQSAVFNALAGLLVLNLYLYRDAKLGWPTPFPELLDHGFPGYIVGSSGTKRVPGV